MSVDETKMEPLPTVAVAPEEQLTVPSEPVPPQETVPAAAAPPKSPPPPPPPTSGVRIRPKICDVRNCDSNSLRNSELLFVCVPGHSYPERRFVWLTLMQAARDKKRSYCCSRHFKVPDDFKDFQEFISAPPGYKRQLLVKKGVVPHLNMPPLNMSALPPLTDRWPMTLPAGMTEAELRHNAATTVARHTPPPPRMYHGSLPSQHSARPPPPKSHSVAQMPPSAPRIRYSKGVQTDSSTLANSGPRKVPPSLQYCRLCFNKHDLEPIFTGDQTLIEPDLIDKVFGCTEVVISVETDFPSSICTGCYDKVHEYCKFRKLVQLNDQSLRGTPLPPLHASPSRSAPSSVPRQNSFVRMKTTEKVPNRPTQKVTPIRPVNSTPPNSVQRSPAAQRRDDPLLEVQRVENVERYQRRQQTIERNQPLRAQRVQDTLYPVPYRRPVAETTTTDDPLASIGGEEKPSSDSETSSAPEGVQLNDRVVPVTLIRIQPDTAESDDTSNEAKNTDQPQEVTVKEEDTSAEPSSPQTAAPAVEQSSQNFIRPKPLHQLMRGTELKKPNPPNVLQAVKLLPSATAKALANQKSSLKPVNTLTRGITSGRFRIFNTLDRPKPMPHTARLLPKSFNRSVRLPGVLSNLIHRAKKPQSALSISKVSNPVASPSPSTASSISEHRTASPKVQQAVQESLPDKPSIPSPVTKSKVVTDSYPNQKDKTASNIRPIPGIVPIRSVKVTPKPSAASPVPTSESPDPLIQPKEKDITNIKVPAELGRLSVVLSKLTPKSSTPSPTPTPKSSKPVPDMVQKDTSTTETSPAPPTPPESNVPPSPRSSRVRKVPLKFQDSVGFPKPKIITVKADPDSPKPESPKVSQDNSKEPAVRTTRRSTVTDGKSTDTPTEKKKLEAKSKPKEDDPPKKKAEAKETATKSKAKADDPLKPESTRVTRRSDVAITKPNEPSPRSQSLKRKSDAKPETKETAPPPSKSPKVVEPVKPKQQQLPKPKQDQRANGSKKSASTPVTTEPAVTAEPVTPPRKPKQRREFERAKTPVSSKDWKCPFCTDRVFEEKKRLVKHLRKRHGMDYALVRQQLAIYGGNWRK